MSSYQIQLNGTAVDAGFYDQLASLEIEENADLPGAISFTLPIAASAGDLTWVGDATIGPFVNVSVVVTPDGGGAAQCVFDGYVLSQKIHLQPGITASTVEVWGQDASVLMALEEQVREWSGVTDGEVANQIFSSYGFEPGPDNTDDDSPAHTDDAHTLMQRASDWEFLRRLARRSGKWCRVTCDNQPGQRTGVFAAPDLQATAAATIDLNDPQQRSVSSLDFHWDVNRPSAVAAYQASLTNSDPDGTDASTSDSGLPPLDAQDLAAFAGQDLSVILTATGDEAELPAMAQAVLRDSGWFARAEGTADLAVLKTVLRVGTVVAVQGVGSILSGNYLVWSVRHTITTQSHSMAFVLVRNAVGPAPSGGAGGSLTGAASAPSLP
jgi:phage protein D